MHFQKDFYIILRCLKTIKKIYTPTGALIEDALKKMPVQNIMALCP